MGEMIGKMAGLIDKKPDHVMNNSLPLGPGGMPQNPMDLLESIIPGMSGGSVPGIGGGAPPGPQLLNSDNTQWPKGFLTNEPTGYTPNSPLLDGGINTNQENGLASSMPLNLPDSKTTVPPPPSQAEEMLKKFIQGRGPGADGASGGGGGGGAGAGAGLFNAKQINPFYSGGGKNDSLKQAAKMAAKFAGG